MDFLQPVKTSKLAAGGAVPRIPMDSGRRAAAMTTSTRSSRTARTHEDMRNFVSDMTRQSLQQYYFGAPPPGSTSPATPRTPSAPSTPTTPSKVGSGFVSNGAFYNGVVEMSRRPDAGAACNGEVRGSQRPAQRGSSSRHVKMPLSVQDDPDGREDREDREDREERVERLFREAMADAESRRLGALGSSLLRRPATAPPRTPWDQRQEGILVREVDDSTPCLTCRDGCPTGYKQHPWR